MNTRVQKLILVKVLCFAIFLTGNNTAGAQGAVTPFKIYEAENGTLGGGATIHSQFSIPAESSPEFEASGRSLVKLGSTGESVSWTTTEESNAIIVRVCIPDAPSGGGIDATLNLYVNGEFRQAINTTSRYSWIYGAHQTDNNPASGNAKRFFESGAAFIKGTLVAAGSTIMLKKDSANTASYYKIDLIMLENVGAPLAQPANTLSVTDFGAIANDGIDDSPAFVNCISACQTQGKGMWIPTGEFHTQGVIKAKEISIYGAGMWYTQNTRIIGGRHKWDLTDCNVQDLHIFTPETAREQVHGHDYGMTCQGTKGYTIQRVWVTSSGAAFWLSGTDGTIKDCRTFETWADGINLNNGPSVKPGYAGKRMTAQNNFIIGSGDDGIALNSQNDGGATYNMVDVKILNNTSIGAMWANGMRIAGGRNTLLKDNLITDPTSSNGIRIGKFGTRGNPCESVLVTGNLILRGCGLRPIYGYGGICVTDSATATVSYNTIIDSPGLGMDVQSCTAEFTGNMITRPTAQGILIKNNAVGSATFTNNTVNEITGDQLAFQNNAPDSYLISATGNSWQTVTSNQDHDSNFSYTDNNLNVYPNPFNGILNLKTNLNTGYLITVFNAAGNILLNKSSDNAEEILDLTRLPNGIYFLRISTNRHSYIRKILKY